MEAIRAVNLKKEFGVVTAVNNVTFHVNPGEIFGLVGPDGAGKTTTMRLLTSVMHPTSGDAWIFGKHTVRDSEAVKEEIGYMSQRFGLYPDLTVEENVHFYADLFGVDRKGREERIDQLLSFSNLTPFKKRQAKNLSGGMKQKLGLTCTLIHTPRVLFLDEPTGGVDPVSRRDFWRILYEMLKQGVTIFVSTAYLDEAERCNRIGLIHQGHLMAVDTPDNIKKLMKGAVVEVSTSEARRSASVIRETMPEAQVSIFGDRVHVVVKDPGQAMSVIQTTLVQNALPVGEVRVIEASLEDVFVSAMDQS